MKLNVSIPIKDGYYVLGGLYGIDKNINKISKRYRLVFSYIRDKTPAIITLTDKLQLGPL